MWLTQQLKMGRVLPGVGVVPLPWAEIYGELD